MDKCSFKSTATWVVFIIFTFQAKAQNLRNLMDFSCFIANEGTLHKYLEDTNNDNDNIDFYGGLYNLDWYVCSESDIDSSRSYGLSIEEECNMAFKLSSWLFSMDVDQFFIYDQFILAEDTFYVEIKAFGIMRVMNEHYHEDVEFGLFKISGVYRNNEWKINSIDQSNYSFNAKKDMREFKDRYYFGGRLSSGKRTYDVLREKGKIID